jgi:DNA-binding transcriptional LysR family regulator
MARGGRPGPREQHATALPAGHDARFADREVSDLGAVGRLPVAGVAHDHAFVVQRVDVSVLSAIWVNDSSDRFDALDLNLLRTLDVLMRERSVTRAATVLGRSQPAVSHALTRLRQVLDDPLLVRQGRVLVPTPRAEALAEPLQRVMAELRRTLAGGAFDPATSRRTFVVACPDLLAPGVPQILAALADAPHVRVELIGDRGPDVLDRADLQLDILPAEAPGVVARRLGLVSQAVIARADHPATGRWGLDAWLASPHVLVRTADGLSSPVDRALAAIGRTREIGLVVSDLLLVPHVVAASDLLFTGPAEVMALLAGPLGLALLPVPVALPRVPVAAMWQERLSADPGHRWFRERVVEAVARLLESSSGRSDR